SKKPEIPPYSNRYWTAPDPAGAPGAALANNHASQLPGALSLPVKAHPGFTYLPANVFGGVQVSTSASWASDRQGSPGSAPPAQRSAARAAAAWKVQAAGFDTTPSTMPSRPSQADFTAFDSSATLAGVKLS